MDALFLRRTDSFPSPWMDWVRLPSLAGFFWATSHSVLGFSRIHMVNPELCFISSLSERCIRYYSRPALSFPSEKPRTILGSLSGADSFINSFMIDLALSELVWRRSLL